MQKIQQIFSTGQQTKFYELQTEIAALEKQVENALKQQLSLDADRTSTTAVPLVYVSEQMAKSGIKLVRETA